MDIFLHYFFSSLARWEVASDQLLNVLEKCEVFLFQCFFFQHLSIFNMYIYIYISFGVLITFCCIFPGRKNTPGHQHVGAHATSCRAQFRTHPATSYCYEWTVCGGGTFQSRFQGWCLVKGGGSLKVVLFSTGAMSCVCVFFFICHKGIKVGCLLPLIAG